MKTWPTLLACAVLSACGKPQSERDVPPPVTNSQGYLAKIKALPDGQLRGVLYRAIIDGGAACTQVTAAQREADQNGRAVWSATCASGARWLIAIGDDGIAQARPTTKTK